LNTWWAHTHTHTHTHTHSHTHTHTHTHTLARSLVHTRLQFKKNGVDYIKGHGTITGTNTVKSSGEGGDVTLNAKNIMIATGSEVTP
jgi:pyruvate/2-oxoglutarate dehydrogenase complex dihydrolipoamide dehydrogenase (E3) component